ncbi:MAG: hypothetical protein JXR84_25095 [Anaerolineae bacterium]|nr:hypothetical protein [Anaerolineae bacterium]
MKTQRLFQYTSVALVVILLFATGPAQGQEPEPEGGPEGTEYILAQPPYTMNYQGYLTDSGGNPLNGTYDLVFRLYDDAAVGTMEWGPETHNNVAVTNGIFQVALGSVVTLLPNNFDEALFLEVEVEGTTVTPRQPLRAVPYAFGLVPGAEVQGDPMGSDYGLYVNNTGTGATDKGIRAVGNQYGIYADSLTDSYAIYSADITYSDEGYAGPNTYVWLPAMDANLKYADRDQAHIELLTYGEVQIAADAAADVDVEIPIQIEVPYGRQYLLRSARIYYKVNSDCYITNSWILGRDFSSGADQTLVASTTDRTSTSFDYYTLDTTDYYTITNTQAPTNLQIRIHMNNTDGDAYLYGVRLELDSSY